MKKPWLLLSTLFILGVVGFGLRYLNQGASTAKQKATPPPAVSVTTAQARLEDIPLRLELMGRTEAYETVALKSRVDGQVKNLPFTEGQHVQQGEILVQLDPADYQAKLSQAEANVAKSQIQLNKAKADVERSMSLRAKGFVSAEKVLETTALAAAADATAQSDAAAAELARLQRSYTTIRAPFSGVVGEKQVAPGAAVKANDTTLAVINRIQPLFVSFSVPEKYLAQLRSGARSAQKPLVAELSLPGSKKVIQGEVRFIDNTVDTTTGTIQFKAVVKNADESLTPGQFISVSLVLGMQNGAITVPAESVQQGSDGTFVYVVKDGVVDLRKVKVRTTQQDRTIIAEGLLAAETVVTEGQLRLTSGARVANAAENPVKTAVTARPESGRSSLSAIP